MLLTKAVSNDINNSVLCWLATVDQTGFPSVSPKQIWAEYDANSVVVADIASANSVKNIAENSRVCLSFVDIFRQRGFKLYGTATIISKADLDFEALGGELLKMAGPKFDIRNVIHISVERIGRILAPSYTRFPDINEADMMDDAYETYGVRPS